MGQTLRRPGLVIAVAVMLIVAACGGDDDDNNAGSRSGELSTEFTGDPVKVMVISAETGGVNVGRNTAYPDTIKAAAQAINADGGINGHEFVVLDCDTKTDPNGVTDCAREAVSEEVIAVLGMYDANSGNAYPVLEPAGIPTFGGGLFSLEETTNPLSYPVNGGSPVTEAARGGLAGVLGCEKINVLQNDVEAVDFLVDDYLVKEGLEPWGLSIENRVPVPLDATDLSTYAAAAMAGDPDCILPVVVQLPQVLIELGKLGYEGKAISNYNRQSDRDFESVAQQGGSGVVENLYLVFQTEPPATVDQFNDELDAAGTPDDVNRTGQLLIAWSTAHVFAEVMKQVPEPYTSADLIQTMDTIGPISFPPLSTFDWSQPITPGQRLFNPNVYIAKMEDNKITPAFGGEQYDYRELQELEGEDP